MLAMPPGPDVEPCHERQVAVLERTQWADWLDPTSAGGGRPAHVATGNARRGPYWLTVFPPAA